MEIKSIKDQAFCQYGKIIENFECGDILAYMSTLQIPQDVVYVPGVQKMENTQSADKIAYSLYGGMPVQIGYCNGHNKLLNAFEYHRDSEINIAVTDMVLILGKEQDITKEHTYDTSLAEAFLVPAGSVIEVYATTLHYAPCHVSDEGFKCVVCLPKGTNTDIDRHAYIREDRLLFARNKWLIAHKESGLEAQGAFIGLIGENLKIN